MTLLQNNLNVPMSLTQSTIIKKVAEYASAIYYTLAKDDDDFKGFYVTSIGYNNSLGIAHRAGRAVDIGCGGQNTTPRHYLVTLAACIARDSNYHVALGQEAQHLHIWENVGESEVKGIDDLNPYYTQTDILKIKPIKKLFMEVDGTKNGRPWVYFETLSNGRVLQYTGVMGYKDIYNTSEVVLAYMNREDPAKAIADKIIEETKEVKEKTRGVIMDGVMGMGILFGIIVIVSVISMFFARGAK